MVERTLTLQFADENTLQQFIKTCQIDNAVGIEVNGVDLTPIMRQMLEQLHAPQVPVTVVGSSLPFPASPKP
jgi:hypothetical protein